MGNIRLNELLSVEENQQGQSAAALDSELSDLACALPYPKAPCTNYICSKLLPPMRGN